MRLFILHGWAIDPNNQAKWQPFINSLRTHHIEAFFLGLPGLTTELSEVWSLDDYVQWLDKQLSPQQPVVLLGHSFGGQLATRYTSQYPDRVAKLILIDSAGIRDNRMEAKLKRLIFGVLAKVGKKITQAEIFRKGLYKLARENDYYQASPLLRQTMAKVIKEEVLSDLSQLNCPVCIIWGEKDTNTPPFMAEIFRKKIPHSQLHYIKDARHSPQFTHPQEVVKLVTSFLTESASG